MNTVCVIPIRAGTEPASPVLPEVWGDPVLRARVGNIQEISKSALGVPKLILEADALSRVERGLADLLGLPSLLRPSPQRMALPAGLLQFPRWGQIYYLAGEVYDGQQKRRLVVSNNQWNSASGFSLAVRTTTSERRFGPEYPVIEDGRAKACCPTLTSFPNRSFGSQPVPSSVSISDMVAIARGIVHVLKLEPYFSRLLAES